MRADTRPGGNRAFQRLVIGAVVTQRDHDTLTRDMPDQLDRPRPLGRERQHHDPATGSRLQPLIPGDARIAHVFPAMGPARPVFGIDERPFQVDAWARGPDQRAALHRLGQHRQVPAQSLKLRCDHGREQTRGAGLQDTAREMVLDVLDLDPWIREAPSGEAVHLEVKEAGHDPPLGLGRRFEGIHRRDRGDATFLNLDVYWTSVREEPPFKADRFVGRLHVRTRLAAVGPAPTDARTPWQTRRRASACQPHCRAGGHGA